MRYSVAFLALLAVVLSSSCSSHKNEAMELTKGFFNSLSDETYGTPSDYYPRYDSLDIAAKSDVIDIDESEISERNDTITVRCLNNFTDAKGKFRQDSVIIYITKNKESELFICNSTGLITIDKDTEWFGKQTGAFGTSVLTDIELSKRIDQLYNYIRSKYWEQYFELRTKVEIVDWSWETSYDGTPHGNAKIKNNLPYSIDGIKYEVTYYDRQGNYMADDDGRISKTLSPGEKYNFTFWSSNAKYPSKANLKLEFSDKLIYDLLKDKYYTGREFEEYIKKNID